MGREVRMVTADWKHPSQGFCGDGSPRYLALYDGGDLKSRCDDWDAEAAKWEVGEFPRYADEDDKKQSYEEWAGARPDPADYMPVWQDSERTHYMMYENTSEGTPISPAFAKPEELARWLADTKASAFGNLTACYEDWLKICKGGWAPSMIADDKGLRSGVEALGGK